MQNMKTIVVAILIVIGSYAQAQQTESEREEAAQDEIKRLDAMITDMTERVKDLHHGNPREIMETCQKMLPELDNAFRIEMMYAPPEIKPELQHDYMVTRQNLLNDLVLAQLALSLHPDQ